MRILKGSARNQWPSFEWMLVDTERSMQWLSLLLRSDDGVNLDGHAAFYIPDTIPHYQLPVLLHSDDDVNLDGHATSDIPNTVPLHQPPPKANTYHPLSLHNPSAYMASTSHGEQALPSLTYISYCTLLLHGEDDVDLDGRARLHIPNTIPHYRIPQQ